MAFLTAAASWSVPTFAVACMLAVGVRSSPAAVVEAVGRPRLVAGAIAANFIAAPLLARLVTAIFPLSPGHATGLLLLGSAAGAPFLPKLADYARGDAAFAVGLMLLLTVASIVFMPLALPVLIPGFRASAWDIARPLGWTMLAPLAAGVALRPWRTILAAPFELASNLSLLAALLLLIGLNAPAMLSTVGSGASASAVLYVAVVFVVGYALGGPARSTRTVLGLGTGQRNIAAALVTANANAAGPDVTVMLIVATLAGLLPLLAAATVLRKRTGRHAAPVKLG